MFDTNVFYAHGQSDYTELVAVLMGLDYGSKRVGVALTDESGRVAFPKATVPNDRALLETLKAFITSGNVAEVVIGESKDNRGADNPIARNAEILARDLARATGVTIHYEPEFYSSQEVRAHTGEALVDARAAAVILNSFLTKRHDNHD